MFNSKHHWRPRSNEIKSNLEVGKWLVLHLVALSVNTMCWSDDVSSVTFELRLQVEPSVTFELRLQIEPSVTFEFR